MNSCLPVLLLSGLLAATGAESPPEPDQSDQSSPGCSPGFWNYDGCNVCRCTKDRKIKCTGNVCTDPPPASCQYGRNYVDQCNNVCFCNKQGQYECKPRGTPHGGRCYGSEDGVGKPLACAEEGEIGVESHTRLFCENQIVRFEYVEDEDRCRQGVKWRIACNMCRCFNAPEGLFACTSRGTWRRCISSSPPPQPASVRRPRPARVHYGDAVVPEDDPCPAGLILAPGQLGIKVCKAQGCTPGAQWDISSCEKCVCTRDSQPACTPCVRQKSDSTVACGERRLVSTIAPYQLCPADCGQRYIPEKDCVQCQCGVGKSGDVNVGFDEPCPVGYDHRANGAFFRSCGPVDDLPKGDYEDCRQNSECPAHCEFVRRSASGCVYCRCEGRELVPASQECPPSKIEGPVTGDQKVCRAANREECGKPGAEYNVDCDLCICQENGVPACTNKNCAAVEAPGCPHGPAFIDQCNNVCRCAGSGYSCPRGRCLLGQVFGKPLTCPKPGNPRDLPHVEGYRVFCHNGVVKAQHPNDTCIAGTSFMDSENCNVCSCSRCRSAAGVGCIAMSCTLMACVTISPPVEIPGCPHGPAIIDECNNVCRCGGFGYFCPRGRCRLGQVSGKPLTCLSTGNARDLPRVEGYRVFCHNGAVNIQRLTDACIEGTSFMHPNNCYTCNCYSNGEAACETIDCLPPGPSRTPGY